MKNTLKKTLSIILAILMVATTVTFAFAAESDGVKTTLDVSKGKIIIADTYVTQKGENIELDPDGYIITGKSEDVDTIVDFLNESTDSVSYDIVFDNLEIIAEPWCTALRFKGNGPMIVNVELIGANYIETENHAVFSNQGASTLTVNISTGGNSSNLLECFRYEGSKVLYDDDFATTVYVDGNEVGTSYIICDKIKFNEPHTVSKQTILKFEPTVSGTYILSSESDSIPRANLYDADLRFLGNAKNIDKSNYNFTLTHEYEAGKTYYFNLYDIDGKYPYTVTLVCKEHIGGTQTCMGYKCEACEAWYGEAGDIHNFTTYTEIESAECEVNAKEKATCDNGCGTTDTREVENSALGHNIVIDEAVAPTCTETGLTEGQHCTRCDDATVAQEEIPALGHADEDGDGICDNGGEDILCRDCGRLVHGDTLIENIICWFVMLINLIKSMF